MDNVYKSMKPLNLFLKDSYVRFVNKNTDEYIDMPIGRGYDVFKYLWPLKNSVDYIAGRVTEFNDEKPRKYHYCILFNLDSMEDGNVIGFMIENKIKYKLRVDIETNKIIEKYKL